MSLPQLLTRTLPAASRRGLWARCQAYPNSRGDERDSQSQADDDTTWMAELEDDDYEPEPEYGDFWQERDDAQI